MAKRDKRTIESALVKKGFVKAGGGKHMVFTYQTQDGRLTPVVTHTSHGANDDLGDFLLKAMAEQCGVTKADFLELVDCPMDQAKYEALLTERGRI